jgi:hypothetical protein
LDGRKIREESFLCSLYSIYSIPPILEHIPINKDEKKGKRRGQPMLPSLFFSKAPYLKVPSFPVFLIEKEKRRDLRLYWPPSSIILNRGTLGQLIKEPLIQS